MIGMQKVPGSSTDEGFQEDMMCKPGVMGIVDREQLEPLVREPLV